MNLRSLATLTACVVSIVLVSQSCSVSESEIKDVYLELPANPDQYSIGEGINNHIPTLGRVLFYDKQLSVNNSVSCASCHKQGLAFADNARFSKGFENRITSRNSMPIQNLTPVFGGFFPGEGDAGLGSSVPFNQFSLFWDGREHNLSTMVLRPILNHVEMGVDDLDQLADKLEQIPYYRELFYKAYGTYEITPELISTGLTQFLSSINSRNTFFDQVQMGSAQLSALQLQGKELFIEKYDCNACHQIQDPQGYALLGGGFANIGLDSEYDDGGLENVTGNTQDAGKFKIPSLRNILVTGPYMHDGRFETLDDVIEHYSIGIEENRNLDARLRDSNGSARQFNITSNEKQALVAFLGTLTDTNVLTDPKFSNPFKTK